MFESKRFSLVKPTIDTPFHIDFDWWKQHDNNWRVLLQSCLCAEHQAKFTNLDDENWVDFVNPETAEVERVDGLQHVLINHCARQPGFLTSTTLVEDAFRAFLAKGNHALTPKELAQLINRKAETILLTLAGGTKVYMGIRPFLR